MRNVTIPRKSSNSANSRLGKTTFKFQGGPRQDSANADQIQILQDDIRSKDLLIHDPRQLVGVGLVLGGREPNISSPTSRWKEA